MNFIARHILEITAICYLLLFLCWGIGYFSNALCGTRFEINSAWQGIGTLFGAGVFSSVKYLADSWKNSPQGENPYNLKEAVFNATGNNIGAGEADGSRCAGKP